MWCSMRDLHQSLKDTIEKKDADGFEEALNERFLQDQIEGLCSMSTAMKRSYIFPS